MQFVIGVNESHEMSPLKRSVFYDLVEGDLFIGGVPEELISAQSALSPQISSRTGYRGCLASIQLDDRVWNVYENVSYVPEKFKDSVIKECPSETRLNFFFLPVYGPHL